MVQQLQIERRDLGKEVSAGCNERKGKLQQHRRPGGRPRDRPVESLAKGGPVAVFLGAAGQDGHVAQSEGAGDVLQKGALPAIGLQQGELDLRSGQGQRQGGEAATATDIDHPVDGCPRRREQGIAIGDLGLDLLQRPRSRQVDALVPIQQQLGVSL